MNTVDRMYSRAVISMAAVVLLGSSCTSDWGRVDPPAGTQTAPTLENIATFEFEDEMLDPLLFRAKGNTQNQVPAIVEDELKGKVLELNDGWVEMNNPFANYKCEKGASLSFWLKQIPAVSTDEDGNETVGPQDLVGPLFKFSNQNETEYLTFSANGCIDYNAADGIWSCDNPETVTTGYIPVDGFDGNGWNYVALTVNDGGYELFVNGQKKAVTPVVDFDCSRLVQFMNNVANFSIGSADNHGHWMIDDMKLYRNMLTSKEQARPRMSWEGAGGDGPSIDLSKWVMVGLEDNTTGFWTEFSPYFTLKGDGEIHYEFYNYTDGLENWTNWLAVIANGERGCDGYAEYVVIRADNYGWGALWDSSTHNCDFNFDTFKQDMQGAHIDMTIERSGDSATTTAVVTTQAGTVYTYTVEVTGITTESITTWLLCERAHLLLNPEGCFVGTKYDGSLKVGAEDLSSPFFGAQSPFVSFTGDFSGYGWEFINHQSGTGNNWENWIVVCTNGKAFGEDGYAEHFVTRSDSYGWGALSDAGNVTLTNSFDWTTYVADMHDAIIRVYAERSGDELVLVARQITADGRVMPEYRIVASSLPDPTIGIFFTVEKSCLEFNKMGFFPMVNMNPEN